MSVQPSDNLLILGPHAIELGDPQHRFVISRGVRPQGLEYRGDLLVRHSLPQQEPTEENRGRRVPRILTIHALDVLACITKQFMTKETLQRGQEGRTRGGISYVIHQMWQQLTQLIEVGTMKQHRHQALVVQFRSGTLEPVERRPEHTRHPLMLRQVLC